MQSMLANSSLGSLSVYHDVVKQRGSNTATVFLCSSLELMVQSRIAQSWASMPKKASENQLEDTRQVVRDIIVWTERGDLKR